MTLFTFYFYPKSYGRVKGVLFCNQNSYTLWLCYTILLLLWQNLLKVTQITIRLEPFHCCPHCWPQAYSRSLSSTPIWRWNETYGIRFGHWLPLYTIVSDTTNWAGFERLLIGLHSQEYETYKRLTK